MRAPAPLTAPARTSQRNPEEPSAGPADSSPAERPRPDQVPDLGSLSRDTFRTLEELACLSPTPAFPRPHSIPQRRSWNPKVEKTGGREGVGVAEGSLAGKAPAFAVTP